MVNVREISIEREEGKVWAGREVGRDGFPEECEKGEKGEADISGRRTEGEESIDGQEGQEGAVPWLGGGFPQCPGFLCDLMEY